MSEKTEIFCDGVWIEIKQESDFKIKVEWTAFDGRDFRHYSRSLYVAEEEFDTIKRFINCGDEDCMAVPKITNYLYRSGYDLLSMCTLCKDLLNAAKKSANLWELEAMRVHPVGCGVCGVKCIVNEAFQEQ